MSWSNFFFLICQLDYTPEAYPTALLAAACFKSALSSAPAGLRVRFESFSEGVYTGDQFDKVRFADLNLLL